jgi:hypothetical protein
VRSAPGHERFAPDLASGLDLRPPYPLSRETGVTASGVGLSEDVVLDSTGRSAAMTIDRLVFVIAGIFIMASLALAHFVDERWLWFTAFVGANLAQSAFTGFCPMAKLLKALGVKPGAAFECGSNATPK